MDFRFMKMILFGENPIGDSKSPDIIRAFLPGITNYPGLWLKLYRFFCRSKKNEPLIKTWFQVSNIYFIA